MQRQRGYVDGELSRAGTAVMSLVVIAVITFANGPLPRDNEPETLTIEP
jgi:hypothetical protein